VSRLANKHAHYGGESQNSRFLPILEFLVGTTGSNPVATELKAALVKLDLPLMVQRALHVSDDDPMMTALSWIQRQTDAHLRQHVESRLVFRESQPRLHLRLQPTSLLGALWLQFALAANKNKHMSPGANPWDTHQR
jgi:hypothetical protein